MEHFVIIINGFAANYYLKKLHLGCCSSLRSASANFDLVFLTHLRPMFPCYKPWSTIRKGVYSPLHNYRGGQTPFFVKNLWHFNLLRPLQSKTFFTKFCLPLMPTPQSMSWGTIYYWGNKSNAKSMKRKF